MSHNGKYYSKTVKRVVKNEYHQIDKLFAKKIKQQNDANNNKADGSVSDMAMPGSSENSWTKDNDNPVDEIPPSQSQNKSISDVAVTPYVNQVVTLTDTMTESLPEVQPGPQHNESQSGTKIVHDQEVKSQSSLIFDESLSETSKIDSRKFNSIKYEMRYNWLYFNAAKGGFCCKYCEMFRSGIETSSTVDSEMAFVVGTKLGDHPTRLLTIHDQSKKHNDCIEKYSNFKLGELKRSKQKTVTEMITKFNVKEIARNRSVIKKLFQCTYFLVRKKWAHCNFEDLVKFVASLGVEDILTHIQTAPSHATYLSSKSVTEFIELISANIEKTLLNSLRDAPYFGLLMDESTDESNRTQLSIMCRWFHEQMFVDHFIGIIHVDKTDAASLMDFVRQFLIKKEIDIKKCRFVALDGTNTMSGENTGLQRRIRHEAPHSLYVNCRNHRLALCLKHLMKDYTLLVEVDAALLGLWKLFEYSPKRFAVFEKVQESYNVESLKIIKAAVTRWLSHGKACIRFINRFESILDTLDALYDQSKEPEIFGLRTILTRKPLVAMITLLCDVLKPMNILSLSLQDPNLILSKVDEKVQICISNLESLIIMLENGSTETYYSKLSDRFDEINERTSLQMRLRGQEEGQRITPHQFLREHGVPFIHSLINEIKSQLNIHPVLKAFEILDPRVIPDNSKDLLNFGQSEVEKLVNHYGEAMTDTFQRNETMVEADIDPVCTVGEYNGFKHQLFIKRKQGCDSVKTLFSDMVDHTALKDTFPNIIKLPYMINIIPASTASVERSFSFMNLIKTPLRSTLTQQNLESLLMMSIEGPPCLTDETLEQLLKDFNSKKDRYIAL